MKDSADTCVLIFIKYPEEGKVKTRLSQEIGEAITLELYKNFILDLLSTLEKLKICVWLCFCPSDSRENLEKWLGGNYHFMPQEGEDLGQRMKKSFLHAFGMGFRRAILMGSDIPDLPSAIVEEAFLSLKTKDVTIGPSFDGGYYLIGFRDETFLPEVFDGITWSTDTVFEKTMDILGKRECTAHVLPSWRDIDTLADLQDLIMRNKNTPFRASRTIQYILKTMEASS